jgi:hypothetical protein
MSPTKTTIATFSLAGFSLARVANLTINQFNDSLVQTLQTHTAWGIAVGVSVVAAGMAAALIAFVIHR